MRKLLLALALLGSLVASAQTISTGTISGSPFCPGSAVNVPFTLTGTFNAGNIFNAQLSDASGSFAAPVDIGSLTGITAGTVLATIPVTPSAGTGYRIRIVSSNPVVTGTLNGSNLTIVKAVNPTFQKTYTNSAGTSILSSHVIQLPDSNLVFTAFGMNLYKSDMNGNLLWSKKMYETHYVGYQPGGGYSDYSDDVQLTADGGFILAGHKIYSDGAGINHYYIVLVKTDAEGNVTWSQLYGDNNLGGCGGSVGSFASSVLPTSDGGYLLSGYTHGFGFGCSGKDIFIKVDANGNHLWTKTLDDVCVNYAYNWGAGNVIEIPGGGGDLMLYASNYPYPCPTGFAVLMRLQADGTLVWSKKIGSLGFNILSTRIVATKDGYYLGSTNGFAVIKTDWDGNVIWSRTFGGEYGSDVSATSDGGCIMTGYAYTGSPQNARVIKVSSTGALQWARDYGSGASIQGRSIVQTFDGGYVMGGNVGGVMYLVKTDSLGNSGGNQSTPNLTATSAGGVTSAYTPVFTSRTPNILPPCILSTNINTTVNTIVGTGNCSWSGSSISLNSCSSLTATVIALNAITCHGGADGSAAVTPSGGTGPYTYRWSNGQTTQTAVGLSAGNYSVTITDNASNNAVGTITISEPAPVVVSVTGDTTLCAGQSVQLNASGATTYSWMPVTGLNSTTGSAVMANPTSTITYTVTGAVGSCSDTASTTVTIISMQLAGTISAADDSICEGELAQLTLTGSSGNVQWQSSSSGSNFADINGATGTSYSLPTSQTTYFRVYAVSGACSDTSNVFELVVNPLPVPVVSADDTLICSSDSTLIDCPNTYSSYLWNNGDTRPYTFTQVAGSVWVIVTDVNGCSGVSNHQNISVYPVTPISIVIQGDTLSSFNGASYQWYRDNVLISGATSPVYIATQSGYYSLEIVDNNGCNVRSSQVYVVVNGLEDYREETALSIYPNPVNDYVMVKLNSGNHGGELSLYDAVGRLISETNIRVEQTVRIENLAAGIYYITFHSGNVMFTRKIAAH